MVLRKSFYIHCSVGRSPRIHEVNPSWDPSTSSSVGSESAPHFYKSPFGSWVRALMEAKEKGNWDLP